MSGVSDLIVIEDSDDEQPVAKQPSTRSAPTSAKTARSLRPPSKSSATQNTPTPPTAPSSASLTAGATSPFTEPSMPTTPSFNSETELAQLQPAPVTPRANGSALPSLDAEPEHPQIAGHHDYDEELSDIEDLMELDPSLVEEDEGAAEPEQAEGEDGDESDSQSEGDSEESGDEEDISQSPRAVDAALAVEGEPSSAPAVTIGDASAPASGEPSATAVPDSGAAAATVSADGTTPMDTTTDGKPVNILKPKVKRPHKAPTPPPAPPPPMQTVRITIPIEPFAGRDRERNYEFDIVELAAAKGINMRPAVPVVRIDDESEDEKDEKDEKGNNSAEEIAKRFEAMAAEEDAGKKRRKSRKRKYEEEQYDLHDGWIDDTELAAQERKFVAETKQKGYYVSLGEVALKTLGPPPGAKSPGKPGPKPRIPVPVVPPPPPQTHPADIPLSDRPQNKRSALARTLHALPGKIEARHSRAMKLHLTTALDLPPANESGKIVVKGYEVDAPGSPSKDSSGNSDQPIAVDDDEDTPGRASHSPRVSTKPVSTASAPGGDPSHSPVSATEPSGRGTKRKATTLSASTSNALANSAAADGEDLMGEPTRKRRRGATMATLDFVHPSFTTDLVGELEVLKEVVEREAKAFGVKGKFPQHVKPLLGQIAMRAVVRDEYDDPFFDAMPKIFPYNRFTMKKLVARTVFQSHTDLLNQRNEELLADLKKITDDGFEKAKEDQKAAIEAWEAKQAKKKAVDAGGAAAADGTPVPVDLAASTQTAADKEKEDKPPQQKYRMNEVIRTIIWDLVCLSNDIVTLANEKSKYENSSDTTSEQSQRKILYQKIQAAFPDGWMNSSILSREVSLLKRKQGEQNMADAAKTTT